MIGIPTALNYWQGWAIFSSKEFELTNTPIPLCFFPNAGENVTRESDPQKHHLRVTDGDLNYICSLIKESPTNFDDPILKVWLPIWEKRWGTMAAFGNQNAKENLDKLYEAIRPCLKGKKRPEELKKIIDRDIDFFKRVVLQKENEDASVDKTIEAVCKEANYWVGKDRAWEVYKAYNKVAKRCLPILKSWKNVFRFLEVCKGGVDWPTVIDLQKDIGLYFVKGEITKNGWVSALF